MGHPTGYTEGSNEYQSELPRCPHGVFRSFGKSYCSVCQSRYNNPEHKITAPTAKHISSTH